MFCVFCVDVLLEVLNCRVGAVVVVDESRLMYCTYGAKPAILLL